MPRARRSRRMRRARRCKGDNIGMASAKAANSSPEERYKQYELTAWLSQSMNSETAPLRASGFTHFDQDDARARPQECEHTWRRSGLRTSFSDRRGIARFSADP